ncbi:CpaD family pilus assembly protein [Sphingomonas bacterium]|uniref:CpaD family pilus assembly protein n=1 Tax=Sphingomonas bacterium TaxID=1895847 RepID=UPI0015757E38|nr:CpaD family pilus assembly protein [Sphingomonas bacterium]
MTKHLLLTALAPALLLGGCMGTENRGLESVHQPVVSRSDYLLDLATAPGGLSSGETQRLAGWMDSMHLGYGDHVAIDDPAGDPRAHAAVAAIVARHGLLLTADVPVTGAPVTPGTVRVVISRMHAHVPGCPDWSRNESSEFNSNTSSNQGCAINSNLAAMIADPADLVRGQPGSGTNDPATSYRAIDAYRKAAPTGAGNTVKAQGTGGK